MNMENLKIALLGVSHWHVPLYFAGLPEHSVVAVSDDNAALAARVASRFDCPYYTDEKQMIRDTKPDFVFAFAPHVRMYAVAAYLLEQHIPFTMEKPAGLNRREVETLYNAAEQKKTFCAIPFVWRYSDTVNDLKNRYLSSKIVHMSYKFIAGPPSRYLESSRWMLSQATAGGGCMTNLGVHFIDMALYLTEVRERKLWHLFINMARNMILKRMPRPCFVWIQVRLFCWKADMHIRCLMRRSAKIAGRL